MDDAKTKRRGGAALVTGGLGMLIIPAMLYVLSIGSVVRMLETGWISKSWEPTLESVYFPLLWAGEQIPGAEPVFTSYMQFWVPRNQAVPAAPPATTIPPGTENNFSIPGAAVRCWQATP